ncbi:MAG: mRNA surveillance protein pelota [Methermicoccaceae archaeon]
MRVLKRALKGGEGELKLVPETLDDLWHLRYLVERGDLVFASTKRALQGASDKLRPEKLEKVHVRLGIRVEKVEFHKFANRLRIHGIIEQGVDVGSHHTLNIEAGTELAVVKLWRREQLERIKQAVRASHRVSAAILTIEEGYAELGLVRQYGIEPVASVSMSYGKDRGSSRQDFFAKALELVVGTRADRIIVAGPGFTKQDFLDYVRTKEPKLASSMVLENTLTCGSAGFLEVVRRGVLERVMHDERLARESRLMDELFQRIATDGPMAYGLSDVRYAVEMGAVEVLLVADEWLREQREEWDVDAFLLGAERCGGQVVVLSSEFEPGQRLVHLGGVAALLRYRVHENNV